MGNDFLDRTLVVDELRVQMCLNIPRDYQDKRPEHAITRHFAKQFAKSQWPPGVRLPELFYDPRSLASSDKRSSLHAKCVVVDDREAFISSANFTEAAQRRNIDVGVLLRCGTTAGQLTNHFERLIDEERLQPISG